MPKHYLMLSIFSLSLLHGQADAEVVSSRDQLTNLYSWEWRESGISIQLVQRLPDQTRAFFQGRGFNSEYADVIGRACVFQTIFRNVGRQPLTYDLDTWRITHKGETLPIQTRERWETKLAGEAVSKAARIALRWSLLPTRQEFLPGDFNWGMTSFGLQPGESFDLSLTLMVDNTPITGHIAAIACPPDESRN